MRLITALLILGCTASLSPGQYVETTVLLPDSTSGLTSIGSLVFHSPTHTMFVGGNESFLVAVNAQTNVKLTRVAVGDGPHVLCSDPPENKVYCANYDSTVTVIDGATNRSVKTIPVEQTVTDLIYNGEEHKLYCGDTTDSLVRVIDCTADSVVARVPISAGTTALCYSPQLNRLYCAHSATDEVTVIDCSADTVVDVVWVRGARPRDICFDSASNCVYTANSGSGTVSVIDCAADTLLRLVAAGYGPRAIMVGPAGKVYCANYDDASVTVISGSGVKAVGIGGHPTALSFDPANDKVYCATYYRDSVAVIDAARDTVVAKIQVGSYPSALCHNPAGNNTYVACGGSAVPALGGVSDTVEAVVTFAACNPGPLCHNLLNDHLYCLDDIVGRLFIIDGDSNRLLKTLKVPMAGYGYDTLIWSPVSNKVYLTNRGDSTVFILDCASDSVIATVKTGYRPRALCCSGDGKVYVANESGGVAVIDGDGDSVCAIVPAGGDCRPLCYDPIDNKVYVGKPGGQSADVIDADSDSVVATIPLPFSGYTPVCWNQNHDKVYASSADSDTLAVIDCAGDTVLRKVHVPFGAWGLYSDSVCDKIYCADNDRGYLRIVSATTDTFYQSLNVGGVASMLDNGRQGPANRLYLTNDNEGRVTVVNGYKTDGVLCRVSVGDRPSSLAWNPAHSRMYVSNSGSSSITVIRDTFGAGVEEGQLQTSSHKPQATVVRGVLVLNELGTWAENGDSPPERLRPTRRGAVPILRAVLLDISGRKVMDLKPGTNDVRALAPGVYFVREAQAQAQAQAVRKVVVTRR